MADTSSNPVLAYLSAGTGGNVDQYNAAIDNWANANPAVMSQFAGQVQSDDIRAALAVKQNPSQQNLDALSALGYNIPKPMESVDAIYPDGNGGFRSWQNVPAPQPVTQNTLMAEDYQIAMQAGNTALANAIKTDIQQYNAPDPYAVYHPTSAQIAGVNADKQRIYEETGMFRPMASDSSNPRQAVLDSVLGAGLDPNAFVDILSPQTYNSLRTSYDAQYTAPFEAARANAGFLSVVSSLAKTVLSAYTGGASDAVFSAIGATGANVGSPSVQSALTSNLSMADTPTPDASKLPANYKFFKV